MISSAVLTPHEQRAANTKFHEFVQHYKALAGEERRVFDYLHVVAAHFQEQLRITGGALFKYRCEGMEALNKVVKACYVKHTTLGARGDRCAVGDVLEWVIQDEMLLSAVKNTRYGLVQVNTAACIATATLGSGSCVGVGVAEVG